MKKLIAGFLSVVLFFASVGVSGENAEADILKVMLESVNQADNSDHLENVQKILISHGYDADNCDTINLYDTILAICELEYGNYYEWPLNRRYEFDLLMVFLGQLPYPVNMDPSSDILTQEEALDIALAAIADRYGIVFDLDDFTAAVSYIASEGGSTQGMWRYGIEFANGDFFAVHVLHGNVISCVQEKRIGSLELEYNELCERRGAFFKWSLQEKMEYANSLPDKLSIAQTRGEINMSYDELVAISRYGFSLPDNEDLQQDEVRSIALRAVQTKYNLPENWYANAEIFYSFFSPRVGEKIWRVIIWQTGNDTFPSGIVELNSESGEVLKIERNGTTPNEFIPYLDRI